MQEGAALPQARCPSVAADRTPAHNRAACRPAPGNRHEVAADRARCAALSQTGEARRHRWKANAIAYYSPRRRPHSLPPGEAWGKHEKDRCILINRRRGAVLSNSCSLRPRRQDSCWPSGADDIGRAFRLRTYGRAGHRGVDRGWVLIQHRFLLLSVLSVLPVSYGRCV